MNISTKNPAVIVGIVLGLGFLLTRKANAQTTKLTGPQAATLRTSISPGTAMARGENLSTTGSQIQAVSTIASFGKSILDTFNPNRIASSSYGDYFPARLGSGVSAEADGTIGEGAAQAFFNSNRDLFITPDPVITDDMTARALAEGLSEY